MGLPRTARASEPACPFLEKTGSRAGDSSWHLHGAQRATGNGNSGSSESWWSLCAARPKLSSRAVEVHPGKFQSAGAPDSAKTCSSVAFLFGPDGEAGCAVGRNQRRESRKSREDYPPGKPGLCDLYLRIDGDTEGGSHSPQQRSGDVALGPSGVFTAGAGWSSGLHLHLL